ncbi:probable pectinesterase/pectinesterase inhibitor 59 [Arachis hypogaea]|uniref:Pectinesterase n=3 Tax=Arachis hypogaea TaxID=3818 RepID=A0A445CY90_ARAHY|nr:pectinesterase-like [Arachis hypogaea]QHO44256.1 putative pectinesterase/pectinesterase inhibitor [Arachis hypogaea]RYR55889.1 hypothetical protein Ahy_A05g021732 isoform C [Arachis hypogaea]
MGRTMVIIRLLLLVSSLVLSASRRVPSSSHSSGNIDWWCNLTPHPGTCKYYLGQSNQQHTTIIKHKTELRSMLVQSALEEATIMQKEAHGLDQNLIKTKNHEAVHGDCLKLYDDTIFHLKRTLECLNNNNCSAVDAQTWLSTALTNIQTCQTGAQELSVQDFKVSSKNTNVTEMVRNSLAINLDFVKMMKQQPQANRALAEAEVEGEEEEAEDDFPSWFSGHERRLLQSSAIKAHVVVAKDGSGNFKTVQEALNAAAKRTVKTSRFVIHVTKGVYKENIEVEKNNDNVMLVGDGMRNTIISGSRSSQDGYTTYSSATAGIDGLHFIARDITFQNTAGPRKGQAVALRSASDLSVFYKCGIVGYQDTLMAHAQRQFYRQCYIYGTVDFIFGNAAVVFQNCHIFARKPLDGQANTITAQGRGDPFQNTGISIHKSVIKAAPDLVPVLDKVQTFLGRPWQQNARVVVMRTYLDSLISPLGWDEWNGSDFAKDTLYFGEYENSGPASDTSKRVKWPGFHVISNPKEASQFTVTSLLAGRTWLPTTSVPFSSGL